MRAVAVMLVLLLAGCAEPSHEAPLGQESDPGPVPAGNETVEPTQAEIDAALAPPPVDLSNLTRFYWSVNVTHGPAAYSMVLALGEQNECELGVQVAYTTVAVGTNAVRMVRFADGHGWGAASWSEGPYVHAVGIDTRSEEISFEGRGAGRLWLKGALSGEVEFTLLARQYDAVDFGERTYAPAAITVECAQRFAITEARTGADLAFFDPSRAAGELGAGVPHRAEVGKDLHWRHETVHNESRLLFAGFGRQAIDGTILTPDGEEAFTTTASSFLEARASPAGTHGFDLDWAAADFYAIWGAVYSLGQPLDVKEGMRDGSAMGPSPL